MTTQYNITTYGTLTNTNGVLSDFSASNYATIPLTFNPVQHPYEIVFKINTGTIPTEGSGIIWQVGDVASARGHLDIEVWNRKIYVELAANYELIWSIEGVTTLSSNTDYWVKLTYNGIDTYSLYLSTNGTTWTTYGTTTSSRFLGDGSGTSFIGVQPGDGGLGYPWFGSIDLNESYIDINGIRWWQGVTSTSTVQTRIQLRHDTATNWASVNPVLLEGEVGIETDTLKQKVGDGVTAWNSLPYSVNTINNTAFDGQWVSSSTNIISGSVITWTSGHNYDLSSYLPNDGKIYEVIFQASWTGSTANTNHELRASTDIITSTWNWLGRVYGTGITAGTCILPVGTGRYVKITTASSGKACNSTYLAAVGYRRVGTNT